MGWWHSPITVRQGQAGKPRPLWVERPYYPRVGLPLQANNASIVVFADLISAGIVVYNKSFSKRLISIASARLTFQTNKAYWIVVSLQYEAMMALSLTNTSMDVLVEWIRRKGPPRNPRQPVDSKAWCRLPRWSAAPGHPSFAHPTLHTWTNIQAHLGWKQQ